LTEARRPALIAFTLAALTLALYGGALRLFWTFEDPGILLHGERHAFWSTLFVPSVYQTVSRYYFTPELVLSFSADRALAGYRPALFYAHQLLALALAAFLLVRLMERYATPLWSFVAAALFLAGAPVAGVAGWLGVRHYVDGLVLALAAILCFRRGLESATWGWPLASAAFFLGAVACKEIYAPVVLVALFLPESGTARRALRAAPLAVAAVLYVVWRQVMLGGYVGGYAHGRLDAAELVRLGRRLAAQAPLAVFGAGDPAAAVALAVAALAILAAAARSGAPALLRVAACAVAALVPILPVGDAFEARYAFVPWMFAAAGVGWAASVWSRGPGRAAAGAILVLLVVVAAWPANRRRWAEVLRAGERSRAEATFFFEASGPRDVVREPVERGDFWVKLAEIRTGVLGRTAPGHAVCDDLFFCRHAGEGLNVVGWNDTARELKDVGSPETLCAAYAPSIRDAAPLSLTMARGNGVLSWSAGPYETGRWAILLGEDLSRYDVPRSGWILPLMPDDLLVTLRYESPEGWKTFSPALPFRMRNGSALLKWSR
jgi:hypothetical protein